MDDLIRVGLFILLAPLVLALGWTVFMAVTIPFLLLTKYLVEALGIAVLVVLYVITAPIRWVHKRF
jgi:hypothetical protein